MKEYMHLLEKIEPREIAPGFKARMIHTGSMTLSLVSVEKGAVLPSHSHFQEQVSMVLEGKFELTIDGEKEVYEQGKIAVIPGDAVHSGEAKTNCEILDIFVPERDDYK